MANIEDLLHRFGNRGDTILRLGRDPCASWRIPTGWWAPH